MHRLPDALSRNPDCRDALSLARIGDWTKHRRVVRGVQETIKTGEFGDDDPPPYRFSVGELGEASIYAEFFNMQWKFNEVD